MNARVFGASIKERATMEEGLIIEAMEACIKRSHTRDVCPQDMLVGEKDLFMIVYNPTL
jgi:hypothetical protein